MQCPACGRKLTDVPLPEGNFPVDGRILACKNGCAGVWLDKDAISLVDSSEKPDLGLMVLARSPQLELVPEGERKCPRCPRFTLRKRYYTKLKKVNVETCDSCGGLWLDHGELAMVRELEPVVREKQEKYNAYIHARVRGAGLRSPLDAPGPSTVGGHGGTISSADGLGMFDAGLDMD